MAPVMRHKTADNLAIYFRFVYNSTRKWLLLSEERIVLLMKMRFATAWNRRHSYIFIFTWDVFIRVYDHVFHSEFRIVVQFIIIWRVTGVTSRILLRFLSYLWLIAQSYVIRTDFLCSKENRWDLQTEMIGYHYPRAVLHMLVIKKLLITWQQITEEILRYVVV
jgi:hypothetical protein